MCVCLCAGEWRGLEVAIKTVLFSDAIAEQSLKLAASEAAIAINLSHENVVATYSHDVVDVQGSTGPERGLYKFHIIQVRPCVLSKIILEYSMLLTSLFCSLSVRLCVKTPMVPGQEYTPPLSTPIVSHL